jgi:hypothetical protein
VFDEVTLRVTPVHCVVPPHVFDAFGWCASDTLVWRRPRAKLPWRSRGATGAIDGANPAGMAFVLTREVTFLPRELAALHVPGLAADGEWALAPWAIDDATDQLYETRTPPGSVLLVAAESVEALVWALHDWAHFHNHGPFDDVAATELQCDHAALRWLADNADEIGLCEDELARARREVAALSRARFTEAGRAPLSPP